MCNYINTKKQVTVNRNNNIENNNINRLIS